MHKQGTNAIPTYRELLKARQKKRHILRNGFVLIALGLFATAGALAVVKPNEPPTIYKTRHNIPLPDPIPNNIQPEEVAYAPYIEQTDILSGDTLATILERLNVKAEGLQNFLTYNEDARSIYKLYPGRSVQAALDGEGNFVWLRYNHSPSTEKDGTAVAQWLEVKPDGLGGFFAYEYTKEADVQIRAAEGKITSSLFGATDMAGIPDSITLQMANILASKVDFMRDIRKNDSFRVVYESHSHEGHESSAGRILAVEFKNKNKVHEAMWFEPSDGRGGYYDSEGRSLKGAFLRTALNFTRISSKFGMRKHPIHGKWTGHKGVDYAAPTGTPIHATADGTIDFVGQQRGYGNTIIIKHHGQYSTLYAHQSRFAKGIKKGTKVSQGDVIGYVGATGWATGPHLHYEFRVANKPVDPLAIDLPVARALEGSDREKFKQVAQKYQEQIKLIARLDDEPKTIASR